MDAAAEKQKTDRNSVLNPGAVKTLALLQTNNILHSLLIYFLRVV